MGCGVHGLGSWALRAAGSQRPGTREGWRGVLEGACVLDVLAHGLGARRWLALVQAPRERRPPAALGPEPDHVAQAGAEVIGQDLDHGVQLGPDGLRRLGRGAGRAGGAVHAVAFLCGWRMGGAPSVPQGQAPWHRGGGPAHGWPGGGERPFDGHQESSPSFAFR